MECKGFEGRYEAIPPHMREGLVRYITTGVITGSFLSAVVSNDLQGAVGNADSENLPLLPLYVQWLYNRAPMPAWGSPSNLTEWRNCGGLNKKRGEPVAVEQMVAVFNEYVDL